MRWRTNCRHFRGVIPCVAGADCRRCRDYLPWGERFLIIKLAAKGDVLRTTPLATAIKQRRPGCHLTWLTDADARPLLEHNPDIDRVLEYGVDEVLRLRAERFDVAMNFDKEPRAAALASVLRARRTDGFGWAAGGWLVPAGRRAAGLFQMGIDDRLKFHGNTKSYQQLVIEAAGMRYRGQRYGYRLLDDEVAWAGRHLRQVFGGRIPDRIIGLNTGVGRGFPTKAWRTRHYAALARALRRRRGTRALIIGGPMERDACRAIAAETGDAVAGNDLTIRQLAALIAATSLVVSPDSLAMHLAIAVRVPVVALFGPTCPQEIDLYGNGVKLSAGRACSPCYRVSCPDNACMSAIAPATVAAAIGRIDVDQVQRRHRGI